MDKIDDLTRGKLREWQMRRLEIKDRMQSQPERTLELSRVLDLMDEEHAEILAASTRKKADDVSADVTPERSSGEGHSSASTAGVFTLQLKVTTSNADDLRKLIDFAMYELHKQIDVADIQGGGEPRTYPGGMSGTLGSYGFELGISEEERHE